MKTIYIKILVFVMFFTGVLQLKLLDIAWENFKIIQALHIVISVILMLFLIAPFIYKHIQNYFFVKNVRSIDGWLLLCTISLLTLSGFYLFFIGNRGGDIFGTLSFNFHLYGSFILIFFFIYHTSKQQKPNISLQIILASLISFVPIYAQTPKLSLTEIEGKKDGHHSEDWTNSIKCKSCHSDIFAQWSDSNHKHMAGSNPYYMVMETLAGEVEGQEFRKWCMGCHNPSAIATGLGKTTHAMDGNFLSNEMFEKNAKTLKSDFKAQGNFRVEEGVSCITCHQITKAQSKGNASFGLSLDRKKYAFEDSTSDMGHWFNEKLINSNPDIHKKSYSNPLYKESKYCASCHDEFHPKTDVKIVSTFAEWEKSPYNNPKDKSKHKTCIDCHMTNLQNNKFSPLKGISTDGGAIKDDVKVHYFSGSNHFLSGLKNKTHEDQTIQLLKTSAKLDVDLKEGKLVVGVTNIGAGHHLPTGASDFRELWLDITVKDKSGKVVLSSGKLKDDGNIETGSRLFQKVFGDEEGKPVGLLFWKYKKLLSDTRIPAGEKRVESYEINKNVQYPLEATIKLNFRIYPQWATDAVKTVYPNLPSPPTIELSKVVKEFK
ncbi:MAG: multiheme c-type cytochrome [Sulfurimonas sp.]|uniref:multiheme c-type cytochrome n=1 Tax=Sulfurimonas sp. TaxID=2022749 RepID=UPI002628A100|nr:multiheme c-type cytochrome [Sulfurimonas sp.]MDD5372957.1 multiheme c-type cytochrome [Sulfurimonas sp.]